MAAMNRGKCVKLKYGDCVRVGNSVIVAKSTRLELYIYGPDIITNVERAYTKEQLDERIRMDAESLQGDGALRCDSDCTGGR